MTSNTTDIMNTASFADWCEKQGGRHYDYLDIFNCAVAQYLKAHGHTGVHVTARSWGGATRWWRIWEHLIFSRPLPAGWGDALVSLPHTFSALAKRLREVS